MAVHLVGIHRPAHVLLGGVVQFQGVSEREAMTPLQAVGDERVREALVCCQSGLRERTGRECESCPHFAGWRDDRSQLRVRCAFGDRDPVRERMTLASALVVTRPHASCREAERLAQRHRLQHLLVVDGLRLVGVISSRDLQRAGGWVADHMQREVYAVLGDTTLGEAVAAMRQLEIGFLPVIGERFVIGVLTRGDLIRAGAPRQLLESAA
jgi:CBS domain-containing protein